VGNRIGTVDPRGNLSGANPNDFKTSFAYDALNRQTTVTLPPVDGQTHTLKTEYDAAGNVVATIDQLQRRTEYQFDGANRQINVIQPPDLQSQPRNIETAYDAAGRVISTKDALGNTTKYAYDARNFRTRLTDALGKHTDTLYDAAGNAIRITDPLLNETHFAYDYANRVIQERQKLPDGTFDPRVFEYDPAGYQVRITDRNDRVRELFYDERGRLTQEIWRQTLGGTVVNTIDLAYNAAGELLVIEDDFSKYAFTYDHAGRLLTSDNTGTPNLPAVTLGYAYDPAGYRQTLSVGGSALISYEHDALGRLSSLERPNLLKVDLAYTADSQFDLLQRYNDNSGVWQLVSRSDYGYESSTGRLSSIIHQNGALATLSSYVYTYDRADRIASIASLLDGTSTYTHDSINQLTDVNRPAGQTDELYRFDSNGNRTQSHLHGTAYNTQPAGAHNKLTADGAYTYLHDDEGNLIRRTHNASGAVVEYGFDHRNRLTSVIERPTLGGAIVKQTNFTYDALDRRIIKSHDPDGAGSGSAVAEKYVYDGDNILLHYNGSDVLTHRYTHGEVTDQVFSDESLLDPSKNLFTLPDHEGSIRDLAFVTSGALAKHINFDSFGRIVPGGSNPGGVDELHGFTGRHLDPETGLQYNRARYYSHDLGRFISQDPAGFAAGDANLYRYVGNSPLMLIDPSGLGSTSYTSAGAGWLGAAVSTGLEWLGSAIGSGSNSLASAISDPFGGLSSFASTISSTVSTAVNWVSNALTVIPGAPVQAPSLSQVLSNRTGHTPLIATPPAGPAPGSSFTPPVHNWLADAHDMERFGRVRTSEERLAEIEAQIEASEALEANRLRGTIHQINALPPDDHQHTVTVWNWNRTREELGSTYLLVMPGGVGETILGLGATRSPLASSSSRQLAGRFIAGATVTDRHSGRTLTGTVDLQPTFDRIQAGVRFPHRNDGSVFRNRGNPLPQQPLGYYREYVVPTPGIRGPGPQRLVVGQGGEMYYTPDHYGTFVPVPAQSAAPQHGPPLPPPLPRQPGS
jgi:RHS repeat-associated protein